MPNVCLILQTSTELIQILIYIHSPLVLLVKHTSYYIHFNTHITMEVQTIKEFVKSQGFTQIASHVRVNTNGYPFVTFIKADNVAENIYFSKNAALLVDKGAAVTKELLSGFQIGATENAAGEVRIKLISNSERLSLDSLLD